jgi:uncharacterized protein YbjT (DUF2867 family)
MSGKLKTALLAGSTGLVGSRLLERLLQDPRYGHIIALSRSSLPIHHPKLEIMLVTLETIAEIAPDLKADDWFCALGTTIKQAGSQEAFRRVDYDYPLVLGQQAVASGAKQYLLVSSIGASLTSSIFYSRVKCEIERDLGALGILKIHLFRPSMLLGERKEERAGESVIAAIMKLMNFLLHGPLRKYRAIQADTVAAAMIAAANKTVADGVRIYEGDQITKLVV